MGQVRPQLVRRFERLRNMGIEHVLEVGRHEYRSRPYYLPEHVHGRDRMEICYLHRGRQRFLVNGRRYSLAGGDMLVVFPGDRHGGADEPLGRGLLYWLALQLPAGEGRSFLNLHGPPARQLLRAVRGLRPRQFTGTSRLKEHMDEVIGGLAGASGRPPDPAATLSHVLAFLLEAIRCADRYRARRSSPWAAGVLRYVERNLDRPLTVGEAAAHARLSVSWFKTRFRKEMGVSPAEYILLRKIELAKAELIRRPRRPIIEVAIQLGFASSQHFATAFRRHADMSPTEFRYYFADGADKQEP